MQVRISKKQVSQEEAFSSEFGQFEQIREGNAKGFEQVLTDDQIYVGGSTDETVQVFLANVEVYVQTMDGGPVDVVADDVVDHLVLEFGEGVCGAMGGDAGRVPRNVTVFITAEENDFSEVTKMASVAEIIEESFSGISSFFHGKLREALNIFELSDRPQSNFDKSANSVEIAKMW